MGFEPKVNHNLKRILEKPYPFDVVDENKEKAIEKYGEEFIIDFGIGDPTDATPEVVREAVKESTEETKNKGYPASVGQQSFRDAVSKYMDRRFGVDVSPDEVVATYGAKYACFHIPSYFLNPGREQHVLIPNPGYPPYTSGTLLAGGKPYYMNMLEENDFLPDLDSIPEDVVSKTKLMFINSPHSPTSQIYGEEKLEEIVDFCLDNEIILVSDECYADLYYGEPPLSVLEVDKARECSIVLNSLSKRSMMTGYAVGFLACKNPNILGPYDAIQRKSIQGVANIIQDAAVKAFLDEEHPARMRKIYKERMQALVPVLEDLGCSVAKPKGTFFLWAKTPDGESPLEFSERLLLDKGVNCVPGNLISETFNGVNPGEDRVRFALVQPVEKINEAADRLKS